MPSPRSYNTMLISPLWYEDLKETLEMVVEESDVPDTRGTARVILERMSYQGIGKKADEGEVGQLTLTNKERKFLKRLTSALGMSEASEEFSVTKVRGWY